MEFFVFTTLVLGIAVVYLLNVNKSLKLALVENEPVKEPQKPALTKAPTLAAKKPGRKPVKPIVAAKVKK